MLIYIDSETIPTTRPDVLRRIHGELVPKARNGHVLTDETKIASWWETEADAAYNHEVGRTALDGGLGEVVCICIAVDNGQVATFSRHNHEHSSERSVIEDALGYVHGEVYGTRGHYRQHSWVGHNVGFDLKFLWRRCVVLGIRPPLPIPYDEPPWRSSYIDTMQIWAGADNRDRVKLTRVCEALGIDVDDDIDGSQVREHWERGDVETIVRHCQADVERVRAVYRRMTFAS